MNYGYKYSCVLKLYKNLVKELEDSRKMIYGYDVIEEILHKQAREDFLESIIDRLYEIVGDDVK